MQPYLVASFVKLECIDLWSSLIILSTNQTSDSLYFPIKNLQQ